MTTDEKLDKVLEILGQHTAVLAQHTAMLATVKADVATIGAQMFQMMVFAGKTEKRLDQLEKAEAA